MTRTVKIVCSVVGGAVALGIGVLGVRYWKRPKPLYAVGYKFMSANCPSTITKRKWDGTGWYYYYTFTCSDGPGEGEASESDMGRMAAVTG